MKWSILGGGLSGLSVAKHLREKHKDAEIEIVDKSQTLGGLCRTEYVDGCLVDIGGSHIMFSKDRQLLMEMVMLSGNSAFVHPRKTVVHLHGQFIPYPIENGIAKLDEEARNMYADSMANCTGVSLGNYESYCKSKFGELLFKDYFRPYNEKIWKVPINELSCSMLSRIPNPTPQMIQNIRDGKYEEGYPEQSAFFYPRYGTAELPTALMRKSAPLRIDRREVLKEDLLKPNTVCTIPLPEVYEMLFGEKLKLDGVGLSTAAMLIDNAEVPFHWIYEPSEQYEINRVSAISNYSSEIAPPGKTLLLFEQTTRFGCRDEIKDDEIANWAKDAFNVEGRIIGKWHFDYAYPSPTIKNEWRVKAAINDIHEAAPDLKLFGRFGRWEYKNMDAIYKDSKELVNGL